VRALQADPGHLIVACDGAARGNPGPAGIGVQVTDGRGEVLGEIARGIGEATNNVAEYTAVIEGLALADELGGIELREVDIESDDELFAAYLERIPVIELDGEIVDELDIDLHELRRRLHTVRQ
jgi:ribonuclease HI